MDTKGQNITQEQFNAAVLSVTGNADWEIVKKGLANDIYQVQANSLEAKSWEEVCESRGFAKGLAYVSGIREAVIMLMQQDESDANV